MGRPGRGLFLFPQKFSLCWVKGTQDVPGKNVLGSCHTFKGLVSLIPQPGALSMVVKQHFQAKQTTPETTASGSKPRIGSEFSL